LSVRVTDPRTDPEAVGVKVTLIVQKALGAKGDAQVFVTPKPALEEIAVKVRAAVPVLVTVMVCGALVEPTTWAAKLRLVAESDTTGWSTPVPVRRIIWGLLGALSVRVSDPTLNPATLGVKVTLIVQFEGGVVAWSGAVQLLLCTAKSLLATTLEMFRAAVPVLVTVRTRGELVVLTA
jgi:hypothetical protein